MTDLPIDRMSLPIGADPAKDRFVGLDEWGQKILMTPLGTRYSITPVKQRQTSLKEDAKGAYEALVRDPGGTIGGAVKGAAMGLWDGLMVPARAAAGETITNGDLLNTAGLMIGGAAPMAAPEGALRSGAMRAAADVEAAVKAKYPGVKLDISQGGCGLRQISVAPFLGCGTSTSASASSRIRDGLKTTPFQTACIAPLLPPPPLPRSPPRNRPPRKCFRACVLARARLSRMP